MSKTLGRTALVSWQRLLCGVPRVMFGMCAMCAMTFTGASLAAVDVNQASAQELQQVKGIGAKTADRIVLERARGPFESLEHLSERLSGIGSKTIVKLKSAGLCAGTADKPCTASQSVVQAPPIHRGQPVDLSVVTPEILRLP